jgi:AcrR family transcriptional regulator
MPNTRSAGPAPRARPGRAAPLSAPERRAAIVDATIPLLREHGTAISTRRIAEAADVAEGTIFSVFDDKDTLVAAAIEAALDPAPAIDQLGAVDPDQPLADRLVEAVRILQHHVADTWQLVSAVGPGQSRRPPRASNEAAARLAAGIEPLFGADSGELRTTTTDAAQALLALTMGCSHPAIVDTPMAPDQIVDLLLDGVRGGTR